MKLSERLRGWAKDAQLDRNIYGADQDICQAADLLEECERALDDIANGTSHSDTCSYELTPDTAVCDCHRAIASNALAKLRSQERPG